MPARRNDGSETTMDNEQTGNAWRVHATREPIVTEAPR